MVTEDSEFIEAEAVTGEEVSGDNRPREGNSSGTDIIDPDNMPSITPEEVKNAKLCVVLRANDPDHIVQDVIREELAEQASYLKILRDRTKSEDVAAKAIITEKLVLTLKKLSDLTTQRTREAKTKSTGVVDFHGEQFQDVLALLTSKILEAVQETGMSEAITQRFFIKLKTKLTGFEDEAAATYHGSSKDNQKKANQNKARFSKVDR